MVLSRPQRPERDITAAVRFHDAALVKTISKEPR